MYLLYSLLALSIGFVLDMILGDPYCLPHPIRGIGKLISRLEPWLRRRFPKTTEGELMGGGCMALLIILCSCLPPAAVLLAAYRLHWALGVAMESVMCYQMLATKCLKVESMKVYRSLRKGDLKEARYHVSMIVGRDTDRLDEEGVAKAAVETVAENTSDGSAAPLLYMALGGAVMGFFYKAVNTMDSMIGYKNDQYLYFGRCAAKLDDALNFLPSRIAALVMVGVAGLLRMDARGAWRIWRRDHGKSTSPNSGQTETAAAGALGVQLLGPAYYFGKLSDKPTIGDAGRPVTAEDIVRANRLLYGTAIGLWIAIIIIKGMIGLLWI